MAALRANDLLIGPRGRGLCTAVADRLQEDPWLGGYGTGGPGALARVLKGLNPAPVYEWFDPLEFLEPMDASVSAAMYWQEPHQEDIEAADPAIIAAMRPLAEAIAGSPASAWWSTPVDLDALRYTSGFDEGHPPTPPALTGARDRLHRLRLRTLEDESTAARRPADPFASFTGEWWSTPAMASLVTTTRPLPGLGSIELAWEEDSFGERSALVWPLKTTRTPRVWEIDRPEAWIRLVARYPLDVTNARQPDWYRTTGRLGPWRMPDWRAVADDYDAVHLSVAGYLTSATRALDLGDGDAATVLAGWNPDQTWWLTDMLATETSAPESWHAADDPSRPGFSWRRASP